ncbi:hypothetical protein ACFC26_15935 [Kitasatospora purpeofusca]|uniref:hypothetical protein n=1 Tax=Kitasatospora purpeofusca TaxID=67352 RepID=UPI0035DC296F
MFRLRRTQPAPADPRVRQLQADLAEIQRQNVQLAAHLVAEGRRADLAEQALDDCRQNIRDGHAELAATVDRLKKHITLLTRDRDGALAQLDAKTLATINAGGTSRAAV